MRSSVLALITGFVLASSSILDEIPDVGEEEEGFDEDFDYTHVHGDDDGMGSYPGALWADAMYGDDAVFEGEENPVELLRMLFQKLDDDKDRTLTASELKNGLQLQLQLYQSVMDEAHAREAARVLAEADGNRDGRLTPDEFGSAQVPLALGVERGVLFAFADVAGGADGSLTVDELQAALFPEATARHAVYRDAVVKATLSAYDSDGDGALSTAEIMRFHAAGRTLTMEAGGLPEEGEEAEAASAAHADHELGAHDADQSGTLGPEEIAEWLSPEPAPRDEYEQSLLVELTSAETGLREYDFDAMLERGQDFLDMFSHVIGDLAQQQGQ